MGLPRMHAAESPLRYPDFRVLWLSGVRARFFLFGVAAAIPAVVALIFSASYRRARLLSFLKPDADPLGAGFQAIQSLIAVGAGGISGSGLGGSRQKLFFLPYPHTDFIYSVVGEELGLIGTTLILIAFLVIAWRGFRTALVAPDRFGTLLALGLAMMVAVQALVNISVVIGLLPTKGIPLPLVSNGGSSLLINLIGMGVLLNISQQASPVAAAVIDAAGGELVNV